MKPRARVKFCWECGNRLRNYFSFREMLVDGHLRVLHIACAREISRGSQSSSSEAEQADYADYEPRNEAPRSSGRET